MDLYQILLDLNSDLTRIGKLYVDILGGQMNSLSTPYSMKAGVLSVFLLCSVIPVLSGCRQPTAKVNVRDLIDDPARTAARQERVDSLRQREVAACMKRKGFPYKTLSSPGPSGKKASVLAVQDPNERYLRTLSFGERAEYSKALSGIPSSSNPGNLGGCFGEATRKSLGPYDILQKRLSGFESRVSKDRRVAVLDKKWSVCMRGKGYEVLRQADIAEKILLPEASKVFLATVTKDNEFVVDRSADRAAAYQDFEVKVRKAADGCSSPADETLRGTIRSVLLEKWGLENASLLADVAREDSKK
jgi:hypothetical protein